MNLQPSQDYKSLWDVNYSGQQFTNTSDSTHVYLKKEGIKQNFSIDAVEQPVFNILTSPLLTGVEQDSKVSLRSRVCFKAEAENSNTEFDLNFNQVASSVAMTEDQEELVCITFK
ncbi:Hypothetical_protein [Hexamita inflata]|uniref:Hypothetical_protein n=1 Tax=Hexamita inflata TaxID=28002 RepID=A0AA86TGA9_9EUKA|nr:Hypothetical protein HINF_LOCUS5429 [Hexamita inflata]